MKWCNINSITFKEVKTNRVRIVFWFNGKWRASDTDLPDIAGVLFLDEMLTLSQINEIVARTVSGVKKYEDVNNKYI